MDSPSKVPWYLNVGLKTSTAITMDTEHLPFNCDMPLGAFKVKANERPRLRVPRPSRTVGKTDKLFITIRAYRGHQSIP